MRRFFVRQGDKNGKTGPHGYPMVFSAMGRWMEQIPMPTAEDMAAYYARRDEHE